MTLNVCFRKCLFFILQQKSISWFKNLSLPFPKNQSVKQKKAFVGVRLRRRIWMEYFYTVHDCTFPLILHIVRGNACRNNIQTVFVKSLPPSGFHQPVFSASHFPTECEQCSWGAGQYTKTVSDKQADSCQQCSPPLVTHGDGSKCTSCPMVGYLVKLFYVSCKISYCKTEEFLSTLYHVKLICDIVHTLLYYT